MLVHAPLQPYEHYYSPYCNEQREGTTALHNPHFGEGDGTAAGSATPIATCTARASRTRRFPCQITGNRCSQTCRLYRTCVNRCMRVRWCVLQSCFPLDAGFKEVGGGVAVEVVIVVVSSRKDWKAVGAPAVVLADSRLLFGGGDLGGCCCAGSGAFSAGACDAF